MRSEHGFFSGPHPRAFVHRGWHYDELAGMENSMAAFRRAVAEGYRYIETDVHATADGVVVVHHDELLDRTTDATGAVASLPWSVVGQARIGGREPVCRIEDLLEELPQALVNIDLKSDAAVEPMLAVLRRTKAHDRVCLASFSEARMARVRRLAGPEVLTSMGMSAMTGFWFSARLPQVFTRRSTRPLVCQVPVKQGPLTVVDRRLISVARHRGAEVHVWTIDDPAEMHRLLDLGVDGLMTDKAQVLKDVLIERGAWATA